MNRILVAGATGQLGRCVVQELKARGYWVRALGRNAGKLANVGADETVTADLTDATRLKGVCAQIDAVISCAGASMNMSDFGDKQSFSDIDHRGNAQLLAEARWAGTAKFVYVSLAEADKLTATEYAAAHEAFVSELRASGLPYTVIRPTGFFGFHLEILKFAAKGRGLVIGKGDCQTNPVHEADVARACVDALERNEAEIVIGGPEIFTRKQTVELAFAALQRPPKLISVSPGLFRLLIAPLKLFNPRVHALMDFGVAVTQVNVIAPQRGTQRLQDYFAQAARKL